MYFWGIWILCSLGFHSSALDASGNMQWARDAHAISDAIVTEILDRWQVKSHWEPRKYPHNQSPQPGGRTAFAVLALLSSGVPSQRKDVDAAITALEGCELEGTYAIAARIMAFSRLPESRLSQVKRDVRLLVSAFHYKNNGWGYSVRSPAVRFDPCICQFVALALSDAKDRGIDVPTNIFDSLRSAFMRHQQKDGGWSYQLHGKSRGSMTAAGYATLSICQRHSPASKSMAKTEHNARDRAFIWLVAHANANSNPNARSWIDYWLLSIGRASDASGQEYFGDFKACINGTQSIARRLMTKDTDGWKVRANSIRIEKLCFALLFLERATSPIAIGWMSCQKKADPPFALEEITRELSRELEITLKWRRVNPLINENADWIPVLIIDAENTFESDESTESVARTIEKYRSQGTVCIWLSTTSLGQKRFAELEQFLSLSGKWNTRRFKLYDGSSYPGKVLSVDSEVHVIHFHGVDIHSTSKRIRIKSHQIVRKAWMELTGGIAWQRYEFIEGNALPAVQVKTLAVNSSDLAHSRAKAIESRLNDLKLGSNSRSQMNETRTLKITWQKVTSLTDVKDIAFKNESSSEHFIIDIADEAKLLQDVVLMLHASHANITITSSDIPRNIILKKSVLCVRCAGKKIGHIVTGLTPQSIAMPCGFPEQRGKCGIRTIIQILSNLHD